MPEQNAAPAGAAPEPDVPPYATRRRHPAIRVLSVLGSVFVIVGVPGLLAWGGYTWHATSQVTDVRLDAHARDVASAITGTPLTEPGTAYNPYDADDRGTVRTGDGATVRYVFVNGTDVTDIPPRLLITATGTTPARLLDSIGNLDWQYQAADTCLQTLPAAPAAETPQSNGADGGCRWHGLPGHPRTHVHVTYDPATGTVTVAVHPDDPEPTGDPVNHIEE